MTLDEAIEIQEQYLRQSQTHIADRLDDAIKLGIEALKLIEAWRKSLPLDNPQLLPGEIEAQK